MSERVRQEQSHAEIQRELEQERSKYRESILPEISWPSACAELEQVFQRGILPAVDPRRTAKKPYAMVGVKVAIPQDITHALFKDKKNPKAVRIRCDDHYRDTHGERLHWICPTIKGPWTIYEQPREGPKRRFLYVSEPREYERFVVSVHNKGEQFWFKTAFDVDLLKEDDKLWWRNHLVGSSIAWQR